MMMSRDFVLDQAVTSPTNEDMQSGRRAAKICRFCTRGFSFGGQNVITFPAFAQLRASERAARE
jgi:hypothetical protein